MIIDITKGQEWRLDRSPHAEENGMIILINTVKKRNEFVIAERLYHPMKGKPLQISKKRVERLWMNVSFSWLEKEWTRVK